VFKGGHLSASPPFLVPRSTRLLAFGEVYQCLGLLVRQMAPGKLCELERGEMEYCLEVLEEVEKTIRGKASVARLEAALNVQYAEKYENKVFQYRWALRHPVIKEAITRAIGNRFPSR
jgi:hypothetical protein